MVVYVFFNLHSVGLLKPPRLPISNIDNEIDLESFKLLDETSLKELIPKVGLRVKFAYRLKSYEAFHTKGTSGRPASGWFEEHLKYSRKRVKKYSTTEEVTSPEGKHDNDEDTDDSVSEEDTQKMKTWLQHNEQPRATMEEYMLKTAKRRQMLIKSKGFKEALVEYPKILLPGMIEQDFQVLQPESAEKLYEKWPAVCKSRHKRKKGRGSMSVSAERDKLKSFCGDIDETVHPQPFTVVLWDLKQKSRQFFVLIERKALPATSLLKAIDTCFKMHFVFDIEYQPDCEASWQFLQSIIYELNTAITKEISSVKAFRAYYNSM
ncbi:hypothetical protein BSL78_18021 [Apostichopus japonicus]|uniref:Sterile alpha motif domain-containing protein 3-like n=1 Tax=Stichopus japonicus TaxID=307972 RepID=A0A2G8KAW6_STIJA|nr:hypothetical protein BSL78_18021 [Apostichopus japonicus]